MYLDVSEKEHPLIMIYHRTQEKKKREKLLSILNGALSIESRLRR